VGDRRVPDAGCATLVVEGSVTCRYVKGRVFEHGLHDLASHTCEGLLQIQACADSWGAKRGYSKCRHNKTK
jgi:hypothetical protein